MGEQRGVALVVALGNGQVGVDFLPGALLCGRVLGRQEPPARACDDGAGDEVGTFEVGDCVGGDGVADGGGYVVEGFGGGWAPRVEDVVDGGVEDGVADECVLLCFVGLEERDLEVGG